MDDATTSLAEVQIWFAIRPLPEVHALDHLLAALIILFWAPYVLIGWRAAIRRIKAASGGEREALLLVGYRQTIVEIGTAGFLTLLLYFFLTRPFEELGVLSLQWRGGSSVAAIVMATLITLPSGIGWWTVRKGKKKAIVAGDLGDLALFLPTTDRLRRRWNAVSLTAGIAEEVVFRAWGLAYCLAIAAYWGLGDGTTAMLVAIALSSATFGVLHIYQGARNALKVACLGAYMALIYVLSGWLWLAMLVHFLVDVFQGHMFGMSVAATDESAEEQ